MSRLGDHLARGGALPSWCTAQPETLLAIFTTYREDHAPILIEATCNQVNQFGGYTGMSPADFVGFVTGLARQAGVDPARVIFGGDHLGPNPWKDETAASAMEKARAMLAAYVAAGFEKIHLDASMACRGDGALSEAVMAARAADLCAVAEAAAGGRALHYIIGTEVPVPGGETARLDTLAVTRPDAARRTLDLHREAFAARGLERAFERVIGVVTQPGVDFGNTQVFAFDPGRAQALSKVLPLGDLPVFEAHSTDYQSGGALAALVAGNFRILKVGPELTFAFRQAVFALEQIEAALNVVGPSHLTATLRAAMVADPSHWRGHVAVGPGEAEEMLYGLSDRVRYYWPVPAVRAAFERLCVNLRGANPAPGIVAQALGALVEAGDPATLPDRAVERMVGQVVAKYRNSTGG